MRRPMRTLATSHRKGGVGKDRLARRRQQGGVGEEAAIRATNNGGVMINNNVITKDKLKRFLFSQIVLIFCSA